MSGITSPHAEYNALATSLKVGALSGASHLPKFPWRDFRL